MNNYTEISKSSKYNILKAEGLKITRQNLRKLGRSLPVFFVKKKVFESTITMKNRFPKNQKNYNNL